MAMAVRMSITLNETTSSTMLKPAIALRGVPERVALFNKIISSLEAGPWILPAEMA
jgi:hypothetical protein